MKRPKPAHVYRTSLTSEWESVHLWGDKENQGYHWTEQFLALEFFNNGGQQTTAHGPNLAEELKIIWIINFKWLEKKIVFYETWELHEIQIFISLKFYWNVATLICMNCLEQFLNYNGRVEELWHTPDDLKAWEISLDFFSKSLYVPGLKYVKS